MKFFGKTIRRIVRPVRHKQRLWSIGKTTNSTFGLKTNDLLRKLFGEGRPERPDEAVRHLKERMTALCREQAATGGFVDGFIKQAQRAVVGWKGISLQSLHENAAVRKSVEKEWKEWSKAENCDIAGLDSLVDMQNLVLSYLITDGEFICIMSTENEKLKLRIVDPLLLDVKLHTDAKRDPQTGEITQGRIRMGIEADGNGKPLRYYFVDLGVPDGDQYGYEAHGPHTVVDASFVIHVTINQIGATTRGMPWMASTVSLWTTLKRFQEAVLTRQEINANRIGFIKREQSPLTPNDDIQEEEYLDEEEDGDTEEPNPGMDIKTVKPGSFIEINPGDEVIDFNSSVPDANYPAFMRSIHLEVAAAMGISYAALTNDIAQANFSSSRVGEIKTRETWLYFRGLIIYRFLERVFDKWVLLAARNFKGVQGGVRIIDGMEHVFQGQGFTHIQPKEQAQATQIEIQTKQRSISSVIRERGEEPKDVFDEIEKEQKLLADKGITVEFPIMTPSNPEPPQSPPTGDEEGT